MAITDRWAVSGGSAFATRFMGRPDTATILRPSVVNGPGGPAMTYPTTGPTVACRLGTSPTTVPSEMAAAGELASVTYWMLNVAPGTDLRPSDRVVVQGVTFEVLGGYQAASWNIADTYSLAEVTR